MEYPFPCNVWPTVILSSKTTGYLAVSLKLRLSATTGTDVFFGKGIEGEKVDKWGFLGIMKVQCSHENN